MLKVQNITFKRGKKSIFEDCSFEMKKGDVVAILGPNGRGKTTLLKSILSLIPLNSGQIHINAKMAYVPQNLQITFDYIVFDVVLMGRAKHLGFFEQPKAKDHEMVEEILEKLHLQKFASRAFSSLSGGEKQLVLIARALVSGCDFLILDEPASALDFLNQKKVLRFLKELNEEKKMSILYTTHFPDHALYLSNKVFLMFSENKFLYDDTSNIITSKVLTDLYKTEIKIVDNGLNRAVCPVYA